MRILGLNYKNFYKICDYIKKEKPSTVYYFAAYECQTEWVQPYIHSEKYKTIFTLTNELRTFQDILNETDTIFYLILGSHYNELYDLLINSTSDRFQILFWPTAILGLEYNGLIGNINKIRLNNELKIDDIEINTNFEYLFINYNNKPHYHRAMMIDYLEKNDLLKHGLFSWNEITDQEFGNQFVYKFKHWNQKIVKIDDFEYRINNEYSHNLLNTRCFISLVTETSDEIIFITEKTYRQFLIKQPFICLASQNHHETLKKLGFLLYDEIFDYSFDKEKLLENRIQGIIDNFIKLKNENYQLLYEKIKHKIEYNKNRAFEIVRRGLFIPEILNEFCDKYMIENRIKFNNENILMKPDYVFNHSEKKEIMFNMWSKFYEYQEFKFKNYTPNIVSDTNYYAVIIEPRCINDLHVAMKSTMYYLNETNSNIKWGLQIFHGNKNSDFVKEITKDWGEVVYVNIGVDNFTHEEHSRYMETIQFWEKVKGEKVLIFQSDSMLIRHGIEEFLRYDYIGAPWRTPKENKIVGNGGLSLRSKNKMLDICSKYQPEEPILEDIFFVKYLNNGMADFETAKRFSMEDVYSENPLGIHKPLKHIEPHLLEKILFKN